MLKGQGLAPIEHVEKQPAVALCRIFGAQDAEVGGELHQPLLVARRELDVGDGLVCLMQRVDDEVSNAVDLRVRASIAERLAAGERFLRSDFKPGYGHCFLL